MGGKGSGRRIWSIEEKRHRVIDKAWELTEERLQGQDRVKYDTAKDIVVKDMVNKEQVDMQATISQEEKDILQKYIHSNRMGNIIPEEKPSQS